MLGTWTILGFAAAVAIVLLLTKDQAGPIARVGQVLALLMLLAAAAIVGAGAFGVTLGPCKPATLGHAIMLSRC